MKKWVKNGFKLINSSCITKIVKFEKEKLNFVKKILLFDRSENPPKYIFADKRSNFENSLWKTYFCI